MKQADLPGELPPRTRIAPRGAECRKAGRIVAAAIAMGQYT
jgi:hypothetical protein